MVEREQDIDAAADGGGRVLAVSAVVVLVLQYFNPNTQQTPQVYSAVPVTHSTGAQIARLRNKHNYVHSILMRLTTFVPYFETFLLNVLYISSPNTKEN